MTSSRSFGTTFGGGIYPWTGTTKCRGARIGAGSALHRTCAAGLGDEEAWRDVVGQVPSWPALAHDVVAAGSVPRATGLTRLLGFLRSNARRRGRLRLTGAPKGPRFHGDRNRHARRLPWRARRDCGSGRRHAAPPIAGAGTGSRAPHGEPISARRGSTRPTQLDTGLRRQAPARHGVRGTGVLQLFSRDNRNRWGPDAHARHGDDAIPLPSLARQSGTRA